uniref:Uncharacterized protein n=1 Tax=Brassica oleracea var. oleracea TaxID=109376 RepID=A0A0D3A7K1_BRAOL
MVQPIRERDQRMDQQYDELEPQQGISDFLSLPCRGPRDVVSSVCARSVPPSAPKTYVDPEVLNQLKDKDDRIAALEQKMADQEAGWEATRRQNEQMMEMMRKMYPNEQFP